MGESASFLPGLSSQRAASHCVYALCRRQVLSSGHSCHLAWKHPKDVTLQMPINSLAMEILTDYQTNGGWNRGRLGPVAIIVKRTLRHSFWTEALVQGVSRMDAAARLGMQLHPRLAEVVERQFLLGEDELAVLAAMKDVEVRIRDLTSSSNSLLGTALMQAAFSPTEPGPLTDIAADRGEQVSMMELFKGAVGTFKNPSSHRPIDYDDPIEAAEIVLLADLLHRILDRIESRASANAPG